jgi:hypothetical protein
MKLKLIFLLSLIAASFACSRPEDKLVGVWEFDNYKIDESGIGFLLNMLPDDWKNTIDTYLTDAKGLTNSKLTFESDLTYKESFSGAIEQFATISGTFSTTPDLKQINLKNKEGEQVMEILEFTDTYFVYKKDFSKFAIPVTLHITYKRVK